MFFLVSTLLLLQLASFESMTGHLQPFGSHRPPEIETAELDFVPDPRTFWKDYVKPRKTVVFRGAAKKSRCAYITPNFSLLYQYKMVVDPM